MVLHNPNNWHWVNKDVSPWAKDWLKQNLVGIQGEEGGTTAKVEDVLSMDGDVDVSQRKGKVITLFDVRLKLQYSGNVKDGATATGSITIPEVAHDTEEDEYVFDVELYSEDADNTAIKSVARSKLVPQIRAILPRLAVDLVKEHGKDIQHAPGSNPSNTFQAPKYVSSSHVTKSSSSNGTGGAAASTSTSGTGPSVNVTTLHDTTEYRTTAEELYTTFTDVGRISAFTRSSPILFEGAQAGGKFSLFGGNVSGSYTELDKPKRIVQKWRLAQWPEGHYSTLKINFEQNDVDHVTLMKVDWEGVPTGQEEVTKRNWGEYYVRSIKQTFGFGTIL